LAKLWVAPGERVTDEEAEKLQHDIDANFASLAEAAGVSRFAQFVDAGFTERQAELLTGLSANDKSNNGNKGRG